MGYSAVRLHAIVHGLVVGARRADDERETFSRADACWV